MIIYRITLYEGAHDFVFEFDNYESASRFMQAAFNGYTPKEEDDGETHLVIEIEQITDCDNID